MKECKVKELKEHHMTFIEYNNYLIPFDKIHSMYFKEETRTSMYTVDKFLLYISIGENSDIILQAVTIDEKQAIKEIYNNYKNYLLNKELKETKLKGLI